MRWVPTTSIVRKPIRKTLLALSSGLWLLNCHRIPTERSKPVSATSLADAYRQSSATVRSQYDGKEITVRGYAEQSAVMPASGEDQGSLLLDDKDFTRNQKVVCWFSKDQAETFSKIKGEQFITVRGVFNGEAGADLKFCKLVSLE